MRKYIKKYMKIYENKQKQMKIDENIRLKQKMKIVDENS